MRNDQLLLIIYLLSKSTTGKEKELSSLYERILNDNGEYRKLKKTIENAVFYGNKGKSILRESETLIKAAYENPEDIEYILSQIKKIRTEIESQILFSEKIMKSKEIVTDHIYVIDKKDQAVYEEVLDSIAKAVIYLLCISSHYKMIHELEFFFGKSYSINQKHELLNTDYLPRLEKARESIFAWKIEKRINDREIKFSDFNYYLEKISFKKYQEYVNHRDYQAIKDNLYYSKELDEKGFFHIPIYVGLGNIISRNKMDIFEIVTAYSDDIKDVSEHQFQHRGGRIDTIIRELCSTNEYIISPKQVVSILNQWEKGYTIVSRKKEERCLFCGKYLKTRDMICKDHLRFQR